MNYIFRMLTLMVCFFLPLSSLFALPTPTEGIVDFQASQCDEQAIRVSWRTAPGYTTLTHYRLYQSADGKSFNLVEEQEAPCLELPHEYTVTTPAQASMNYFYLELVDIDGQVHTSSIISCVVNSQSIRVYPNPIERQAVFSLIANRDQQATFWLYTRNGQLVRYKTLNLKKGLNKQTYDLSFLEPGEYFAKGLVDERMVYLKLIKR